MSPVPAPDPVSDEVTAQSLGLGKYIASGFGGEPTWVDPAADDWEDVVAHPYSWVQFSFAAFGCTVTVGQGDGTISSSIFAGSGQANFYATDGVGWVAAYGTPGQMHVQVAPTTGQVAPLLELLNAAGDPICAIAPDGKVGGVTPNDGDQLTWDAASGTIKWKGPLV